MQFINGQNPFEFNDFERLPSDVELLERSRLYTAEGQTRVLELFDSGAYDDFIDRANEFNISGESIGAEDNHYMEHWHGIRSIYELTSGTEVALEQGFQPRKGLEIFSPRNDHIKRFFFSDIATEGSYSFAVMYTELPDVDFDGSGASDKVKLAPRMLYKSNSDGGWRVARGIDKNGRFIKGAYGQQSHYVQETKLHPRIEHILERLGETERKFPKEIFQQGHYYFDTSDTMPNEVSYHHWNEDDDPLEIARIIKPGRTGLYLVEDILQSHGYENLDQYIDAVNKSLLCDPRLKDFIPIFAIAPEVERRRNFHTILGDGKIMHYASVFMDRPIIWKIGYAYTRPQLQNETGSYNGEAICWVDNVCFADVDITSYGTSSEVLDCGILTAKPLEYKHHAAIIDYRIKGQAEKYDDIRVWLSKLMPLQIFSYGTMPNPEIDRLHLG